MDLLTQLNHAMEFVEEHICDDVALADVSVVTSYSPYHFGRMFYYIAEMPFSEYIRKRKLSLAAIELKAGDIKVIDIAVKYGYDSADSFTRAFMKQHGVTPTVARQKDVLLKIFPPLTFQIKIKGVQEMNWRIEQKEAFEVFGIEKLFGKEKVSEFWDECAADGSRIELFKQAELLKQPAAYGLIGYNENVQNSMSYMICILKEDGCKTDGYKIIQVPKLTWAIFHVNGLKDHGDDQCQIGKLFNRAYSEWLPSSGYEKAKGPEMEVYGHGFEEVWIPVVKK